MGDIIVPRMKQLNNIIRMNKQLLLRAAVVASVLAAGALTTRTHAQSADAIIDKLVDKGILTQQEAKELREEADHAFDRAYKAKSGLPDWVTQLKLGGDMRGRFEHFHFDNDSSSISSANRIDRSRFRYRLRAGVTATMFDNIEAGFRLTSSDPKEDSVGNLAMGGDPISGNTTFQNNAAKKSVFFDLAYGKWTPLNRDGWTVTTTVGKMENPFVTSDMVFDGDYTPEGAALNVSYQLSDQHQLKLNGGGFILDESRTDSNDPFLTGVQLRWDGKYGQREGFYLVESSLGLGWYGITDADHGTLGNAAVQQVNAGNTRTAGGNLVYSYSPFVVDATLAYHLNSMPYYNGVFPIRLGGEFIHNPGAPSQNSGWWVGVTLGKAGKKRTWELAYRYKHLESDAWYEELVDSDFGAFYQVAMPGSGASYYASGTNVKGHIFKLSYSPYDSLTFTATYFLTELINPNPANSKSGTGRLQVDANWKF